MKLGLFLPKVDLEGTTAIETRSRSVCNDEEMAQRGKPIRSVM